MGLDFPVLVVWLIVLQSKSERLRDVRPFVAIKPNIAPHSDAPTQARACGPRRLYDAGVLEDADTLLN